jgi:hypothetical protein
VDVTVDDPYPTVTYKLRAKPRPDGEVWSGAIQALFSVDGQTMGMAVRSIAVVGSAELLGTATPPAQDPTTVVGVPTEPNPADLTVRILLADSESEGRLLWTFENAHGFPVPDERVVTDIGDKPEAFTKQLVSGISDHRNQAGLVPFLQGIGETVAEQAPPEFFDLLTAIAHKVRGAPTLLLLSEEPYVPWELMVLDPPIDRSAPPFLAAQVEMGRWVLGQRRPKLPPPILVDVKAMAVVSGKYDDAAWQLAEAEEEATEMHQQFGAKKVDAIAADVFACLGGRPPAEVLHFALHGVYSPEDDLDGLILVDGTKLDPYTVRGTDMSESPFVFLNACQVGCGDKILGDYAGLAEAFLHAGASGAVAPLWSVDDAAAKDLALRFYERVIRKGDTPAEVLRDERRSYAEPGHDGSATCLAYQLFGHPAMVLRTKHR